MKKLNKCSSWMSDYIKVKETLEKSETELNEATKNFSKIVNKTIIYQILGLLFFGLTVASVILIFNFKSQILLHICGVVFFIGWIVCFSKLYVPKNEFVLSLDETYNQKKKIIKEYPAQISLYKSQIQSAENNKEMIKVVKSLKKRGYFRFKLLLYVS